MPDVPCRHGRVFAFEPHSTALVVIDMQREFLDAEGATALAGADIAPLRAIVPTVAAVLGAARAGGLAVIHTREGHAPDLSDLSAVKRQQYAASGIAIGAAGPLGRRFVCGEAGHGIIPELAPAPGEAVVDKPGFGAFYGTGLDAILARGGIERLILAGVTTQCCVHSTLREAVDRGYACLTLADACASGDPELHEATLRIIASEGHLFGWIAAAADLCTAIDPQPAVATV